MLRMGYEQPRVYLLTVANDNEAGLSDNGDVGDGDGRKRKRMK